MYTGRQQRAIQAVMAVVDRFGLQQVNSILLKDSNHVSIHLAPYPIVARVRMPSASQVIAGMLQREIRVAQYLIEAKAPVTSPSFDLPPGPHFHEDIGLTLWQFIEHRPVNERDSRIAAESLRIVHEALVSYEAELPSYMIAIESCQALLEDQFALPALVADDRDFLLKESYRFGTQLNTFSFTPMSLHGDCHLGNVLMTPSGVVWTDFESVCQGPREWDLTCLPEEVLRIFPSVDRELYTVLRDLRSFCVAVWCWVDPDRSPEKREAAEYHLQRLRRQVGSAT